jgi:hypothetical protein
LTIGARIVLASILTLAPAARAQPAPGGGLPESIVTAQALGGPEEKQIEAFVAGHAEKLSDPSAAVRERARDALLAPLGGESGEPSVKFRIEFSKALAGRIRPLVTSKDQGVALSALRIAGALASQAGVEACLEALADERPAVRRMAAFGLGQTLATDPRRSVVPQDRVEAIVETLEKALARETDLLVVDGMALALATPEESPLRSRGLQAVFRGVGRQAATRIGAGRLSESQVGVFLRAVKLARETVTRPNVDKAMAVDAALLAGHTLALSLDQLEVLAAGGDRPSPESTVLDDLAIASEATVIFGHGAAKNERTDPEVERLFPRAMSGGDAGPLRAAVMKWIGPGGRLTQPPYGAKPEDFLKGGAR